MRELIDVFFRHTSQWINDVCVGRIVLVDDFLQQDFDRFCAPAVAILGKKRGDVAEIQVPMGKVRFEILDISFSRDSPEERSADASRLNEAAELPEIGPVTLPVMAT